MKEDDSSFRSRRAQIAVVVPHDADEAGNYWRKAALPFVGIPDADGVLGKRYGQEWHLVKLGRMPALFVVDRKSLLAYVHYARHMADIPNNTVLFKILEGLNQ